MLILTRKKGQSLVIGEDIEISIVEVSGDKVKIGIDAPRNIKIFRSELVDTMEQNRLAAGTKLDRKFLEKLANNKSMFQPQLEPKPGRQKDNNPDCKD